MLRTIARRASVMVVVGLGLYVGITLAVGMHEQQAHAASLIEYTVLLFILLVAVIHVIAAVGGWLNTQWADLDCAISSQNSSDDTGDSGQTANSLLATAPAIGGAPSIDLFVQIFPPGDDLTPDYSGKITLCLCSSGGSGDGQCAPTVPWSWLKFTGTPADGGPDQTAETGVVLGRADECAEGTGTFEGGALVSATGDEPLVLAGYVWNGQLGPRLFTATLANWTLAGTPASLATEDVTFEADATYSQFEEAGWTAAFGADFAYAGYDTYVEDTLTMTGRAPDPLAIPVGIDIKPGSDDNTINLGSNGSVPVAILSSDAFGATTVDARTCSLEGANVAVHGKSDNLSASTEDVNGDGLPDLVAHFDTDALELSSGASTASVECSTLPDADGRVWPIRGQDTVTVVSL